MADSINHAIRAIDIEKAHVTTLAGTGLAGQREGAPSQAQFDLPQGVVVLPGRVVCVGDTINRVIRAFPF